MARLSPYKRLGGWQITVTVKGQSRYMYLPKGTTVRDANRFHERIGKLERAKAMATEVEPSVAEWVQSLDPKFRAKLAKAGLIEKPVEQAAVEAPRLGAFIDSYIAGRRGLKPNTIRNLRQTRGRLVAHFGEHRQLDSITPGHADEYREALVGEGLAAATIAREVKRARQVFHAAVRKRVIPANPFEEVKGGKQENPSRFHFVSMADYEAILCACPNLEWRVLVALGRIGGLRIPSEVVGLRWADVDWHRHRFTVHSPKLEAHPDKAARQVPLFPPLRAILEKARQAAPQGTEFVLPTIRQADRNLRTQFCRIIERAGLVAWEKPFVNLRASRATELAHECPSFLAATWLGHSEQIADVHYRRVRDEDFEMASRSTAKSTASVPQKVPWQDAAPNRTRSQETQKALAYQGFMQLAATPLYTEQSCTVPPRGVEPLFSD